MHLPFWNIFYKLIYIVGSLLWLSCLFFFLSEEVYSSQACIRTLFFLLLNSIPLYGHAVAFIHSLIYGLSTFLANMNPSVNFDYKSFTFFQFLLAGYLYIPTFAYSFPVSYIIFFFSIIILGSVFT